MLQPKHGLLALTALSLVGSLGWIDRSLSQELTHLARRPSSVAKAEPHALSEKNLAEIRRFEESIRRKSKQYKARSEFSSEREYHRQFFDEKDFKRIDGAGPAVEHPLLEGSSSFPVGVHEFVVVNDLQPAERVLVVQHIERAEGATPTETVEVIRMAPGQDLVAAIESLKTTRQRAVVIQSSSEGTWSSEREIDGVPVLLQRVKDLSQVRVSQGNLAVDVKSEEEGRFRLESYLRSVTVQAAKERYAREIDEFHAKYPLMTSEEIRRQKQVKHAASAESSAAPDLTR